MVVALAMMATSGGCSSGSADSDARGAGRRTESLPDAAIVNAAGDATWRVETEGCSWLGSGSAFAVDAHHLVTNRHVIANDTSPVVRSRSGRVLEGRVIGAAERPDVAVIEVAEDLGATVRLAPAANVDEGEHLVVLGYPMPDQQFTVSTGSVVSFHGTDREAILTNAPIAPGNSGGPALRSDGTVAGIVTQMTLDDPQERVAIAFTSASIEPVIDAALAAPVDVLSTCGLGPDYVPPAPPDYDIGAPPPPAVRPPTSADEPQSSLPAPAPAEDVPVAPTVATAPQTTPTTTAPPRSSPTTTPCPSGQVTATLESFQADAVPEQPGWYYVAARGTVTNATGEPIHVARVVAVVRGDPPQDVVGFPDTSNDLPPQASDTWRAEGPARTSEPPSTADIRVEWTYEDRSLAHCDP